MRIHVYAEQCLRAAQVCLDDDLIQRESADIWLWGDGPEEELIRSARTRLAVQYDRRPGGAGDSYMHRCARVVLDHLGAEETEEVAESD